MKRGESLAERSDRIDANAERLEASPHVVYRAFDSYGVLLYVGCTVNLKNRMATHRHGPWHRFASTIATVAYTSRSDARAAEKTAIDTEAAYFNSTQADIQRTQANKNAGKQSLWSRGWFEPTVGPEVDHRDEAAWSAAWDAIEEEVDAWRAAVVAECRRLKDGPYPYMNDRDRLTRYLAARADAELARKEAAA